MTITELEGTQFCSTKVDANNKNPEREIIERDIAAFLNNGGVINSIPTGLSGNTYSNRPLTKKQARDKLNRAIRHQRER